MNIIRERLRVELRPQKPYLFFGPSASGKKTCIRQCLEAKDFIVVCYTQEEARGLPLQPASLRGAMAYIVSLDSAEVLKRHPRSVIIYTAQDPYSWNRRAEELKAAYTLVNLNGELNSANKVEATQVKEDPWERLETLANVSTSIQHRLDLLDSDPMIVQVLHNNMAQLVPNIDGYSRISDQLSALDHSFYIDETGLYPSLLEMTAILRGSNLRRGTYMNWTRAGLSNRFKSKSRPNRVALESYGGVSGLSYKTQQAGEAQIRKAAPEDQHPAPGRRAPHCKQCKVPLKGHRCSHRTPKIV